MSAWLDVDVDVDLDLELRLQNCSLRTFWALADFCWMYIRKFPLPLSWGVIEFPLSFDIIPFSLVVLFVDFFS